MTLRIYADFNSISEGGYCWCLWYNDTILDEAAEELGLVDGQKVILFYEDPAEEFEFDAVLLFRKGRWIARYDESSYRLLRDDSDNI